MKTYIGCKIIEAEPDVERDAHGAAIPDGREGYKVVYPDSYVSWSPKDVFEEAYFETPSDEAGEVLGRAIAAIVRPGVSALSSVQAQGINAVKEAEARLNWTLDMIRGADFVDPRLVAIAATQFELGFMALVKALANPERIVIAPDETGDRP